jgi:hypothetical protein
MEDFPKETIEQGDGNSLDEGVQELADMAGKMDEVQENSYNEPKIDERHSDGVGDPNILARYLEEKAAKERDERERENRSKIVENIENITDESDKQHVTATLGYVMDCVKTAKEGYRDELEDKFLDLFARSKNDTDIIMNIDKMRGSVKEYRYFDNTPEHAQYVICNDLTYNHDFLLDYASSVSLDASYDALGNVFKKSLEKGQEFLSEWEKEQE